MNAPFDYLRQHPIDYREALTDETDRAFQSVYPALTDAEFTNLVVMFDSLYIMGGEPYPHPSSYN